MDADDAIEDDWLAKEMPQTVREELYARTPRGSHGDSQGSLRVSTSISVTTFVSQRIRVHVATRGSCCDGVCQAFELASLHIVRRTSETFGSLVACEAVRLLRGCLLRFEVPEGRSGVYSRSSFCR